MTKAGLMYVFKKYVCKYVCVYVRTRVQVAFFNESWQNCIYRFYKTIVFFLSSAILFDKRGSLLRRYQVRCHKKGICLYIPKLLITRPYGLSWRNLRVKIRLPVMKQTSVFLFFWGLHFFSAFDFFPSIVRLTRRIFRFEKAYLHAPQSKCL